MLASSKSGNNKGLAAYPPENPVVASTLEKKKMSTTTPAANEVVRLIAQNGGFLGRKSDGEPGAKTI
jgi:hypothetical protein